MQHQGCWVNIVPAFLAEVAEIIVVDEALARLVQVVEDEKQVTRAQLDFEVFHPQDELVEADPVVEVQIEEAEGRAEVFETLLNPGPDKIKHASEV